MIFQFSAGGVVFRKTNGRIEILLAQHSQHHGWVFPKGIIGDSIENESKEATALREVKEETGIDATILKPLEPVTYWFQHDGQKIKKTVYYFLMHYIGGDISDHDDEMESVEWLPLDEVKTRLSYPSDKKVWEQARTLIYEV